MFIASPAQLLFFYYIFARCAGLFLLSPLLIDKPITLTIRLFLTLCTALLLSITLFPHANLPPPDVANTLQEVFIILVATLKELAIGYLIGFCFNILFEALLLAGDIIDNMIGFTTAQVIDPITSTMQSLITRLLVFTALVLMFALDLHHLFFRALADSFTILPLGTQMSPNVPLGDMTIGTSTIFTNGLKIAAIPFVILSLSTICVGFISRALPEFNPLVTGIALRIVVGLFALAATFKFLPLLVNTMFNYFNEMTLTILNSL